MDGEAETRKRKWEFFQDSDMVYTIRWDYDKANRPVTLCLSDLHIDNPACNRKALMRVLNQALAKDSPIFIFGDLFCAMQGKYDPRGNKDDIRPEHNTIKYLDALVDTTTELLKPFAKNIALIGSGNHETSILKRHETSLISRLCGNLRSGGGITLEGGFHGFVRVVMKSEGSVTSESWYYHHGFGGGGPVTKGFIDFNRLQAQVDADVYLMGHIHRLNRDRSIKLGITSGGKYTKRVIDCIRMASWKEEGIQPHGWHIERGMGPRPIGGWWCRHTFIDKGNNRPDRDSERRYIKRSWTEAD